MRIGLMLLLADRAFFFSAAMGGKLYSETPNHLHRHGWRSSLPHGEIEEERQWSIRRETAAGSESGAFVFLERRGRPVGSATLRSDRLAPATTRSESVGPADLARPRLGNGGNARRSANRRGATSEAVEKLQAPALSIGTLIHRIGEDRALICVSGTDYVCNVDPALPEAVLEPGMRVLLNEAFAVTDSFGLDKSGPVVKIAEVLEEGRLRVSQEAGISDAVVIRSSFIGKEKLKPGTGGAPRRQPARRRGDHRHGQAPRPRPRDGGADAVECDRRTR